MGQQVNSDLSFLPISNLRQLSALSSWRSLMAIGLEWTIIFLLILLHQKFPHPIVYLLVWIGIATRLYALYSLLHEAIHYLIHKNKAINDFIAHVFLAFPLFISYKKMRIAHFAHHKYLKTDKDPETCHTHYSEFQFPMKLTKLIGILFLDAIGFNFVYYKLRNVLNRRGNFFSCIFIRDNFKSSHVVAIGYFLILAAALYFNFYIEIFLYWILPYITIYQMLNRIRLFSEHYNLGENSTIETRTVIPKWFEKIFLNSYNLGYHAEHHFYPSVPFYNLPELHENLSKNSIYHDKVLIEKSYFAVFKKCIET